MRPDTAFLDELVERAAQTEIVDTHQHLGTWRAVSEGWDPMRDLAADMSKRIEILDKGGVDGTILMPATQRPGGAQSIREANDAVLAQVGQSPRFRHSFFTVPLDSPEVAIAEADRCLALGFKAMVVHHRYEGRAIDHPVMWPILEFATNQGFPVYLHAVPESSTETLWRLERVAEAFPKLTIVALDALSTPANAIWAMQVARRRPNLLFDTALMLPMLSIIETFSSQIGAERLLYGSDLLVMPPSEHFPYPLFEILAAPISEEQRSLILGGNLKRLLG